VTEGSVVGRELERLSIDVAPSGPVTDADWIPDASEKDTAASLKSVCDAGQLEPQLWTSDDWAFVAASGFVYDPSFGVTQNNPQPNCCGGGPGSFNEYIGFSTVKVKGWRRLPFI
jgi:hypothetical protein